MTQLLVVVASLGLMLLVYGILGLLNPRQPLRTAALADLVLGGGVVALAAVVTSVYDPGGQP